MIVLTLARKPLIGSVAQTVLMHGTGGINIDESRVGTAASKLPSGMDRYNAQLALLGYRPAPYPQGTPPIPIATERWPANLILCHLPGCRKRGIQQVRGNRTDTRPSGDDGRQDKTNWRFRPTDATRRGYSNTDGMETVDTWDCQSGCPVSGLDELSGTLPATGRPSQRGAQSGGMFGFGGKDRRSNSHYDVGGASRFFKQVGGSGEP